MIQFLRVKNLALVEKMTIEFQSGFNIITGETGAGKSVLLGALALLAGARADKTIIRTSTEAAEVEGSLYFQSADTVNALLQSMGIPLSEEKTVLIRRIIAQETNRSRIIINGSLATLTNLRQLGSLWIDFHGPDEPQKLFQGKYQLSQLDHYAQLDSLRSEYRQLFQQRTKWLKKRELLMSSQGLNSDEIAFYLSQIERIDQLNPTVESIEILEKDYNHFIHKQELVETSATLIQELSEGEEAVTSRLQQLFGPAQRIAAIDPEAAALTARMEGAIIEIEDIASAYRHFQSEDTLDQEETCILQQRMEIWQELKRKYGDSVQAIIEKRQQLIDKIDSQTDVKGHLETLQREIEGLEKKLKEQAQQLREQRQRAAKRLAQACQKELNALGFKKARLNIEIILEKTLTEWGDSSCIFQFASDAGQPLMPMEKVASSGETARLMLALKTVLAQYESTGVLVFDEIDANVGGEIGNNVGNALRALSKGCQIFCVTHLPQVAAQASCHYCVEKTQREKHSLIAIKSIHESRVARIKELARMLGDRNSPTALTHAVELLS